MTQKMKNESEFIFDDIFNIGYVMIPNDVLNDERISDAAVGLYSRIIQKRNSVDSEGNKWKIYQSTFVTKKDGKDKISSQMNELIEAGYIVKDFIREKGQIKGVFYKVFATSRKKIDQETEKEKNKKNNKKKEKKNNKKNKSNTPESVGITNVQPKPENPNSVNPISENPNSENPTLYNKYINKKIYNIINNTSTTGKNFPGSSEHEEVINFIESNTHLILSDHMKNIVVKTWKLERTVMSVKIFRERNGQQFALLKKIYYDNKNFAPKEQFVNTAKPSSNNTLKFANFTQRDYDYESLEKQLLGWDRE